jgi:hypothetical protein
VLVGPYDDGRWQAELKTVIINFGWTRNTKRVAHPALTAYCYRCIRNTNRELWRETEWVCFFALKTLPFLWKHFLVCERCGDAAPLDKLRYRQLSSPDSHGKLRDFLEEQQLALKNDTQRNFLRAQRAQNQ